MDGLVFKFSTENSNTKPGVMTLIPPVVVSANNDSHMLSEVLCLMQIQTVFCLLYQSFNRLLHPPQVNKNARCTVVSVLAKYIRGSGELSISTHQSLGGLSTKIKPRASSDVANSPPFPAGDVRLHIGSVVGGIFGQYRSRRRGSS